MDTLTESPGDLDGEISSQKRLASRKRIGLLGPHGFGNLGDAATQDAVIQQVSEFCTGVEIHGFSQNPDDTSDRHKIPSFLISSQQADPGWLLDKLPSGLRRRMATRILIRLFIKIPAEVILALRSFGYLKGFDLLIASGGGQLDDVWGGALGHPYTLFKWAVIARMRKTKFMFASVGAGPIHSPLSRLFIRLALSLACYRSYRDENSKSFLKSIGFEQDDPVYPDLAFGLRTRTGNERPHPTSPFPVVGIGPIAYCDARNWPGQNINLYMRYLRNLAQFVVWLVQSGYPVLLFPGEAVHDRLVIEDLKDILRLKLSQSEMERIVDRPITTVDKLMEQLSETDLVVASRFHGVLLPLLLNKPVLALSYHRKIDVLMADMGLGKYCLPIDSFDIEVLKVRFKSLEANETTLGKQINAKVEEYKRALDEQYVRLFKSA